MRRRLLASTLAAVAVAVLLVGAPLAVAVRSVLTGQALDDLQREAEQAQLLVEEEARSVRDVAVLLQTVAARSGTRLTLLDRTGTRGIQIDTGAPPADETFFAVTDDFADAGRGRVGRVTAEGMLAVSLPVRGGGVDQVVRAARTDADLRAAIRRSWLAIGALGMVALGVGAALAWRQGERFAAPLEALAASARRLGDGDFSVRAPRSGLQEADEVGAALDVTASRLGASLARSRSLAEDASHQLRTPLTALRLQLEALAVRHDPTTLAAAEAEAQRLEATIAELLDLAEPPGGAEPVDLAELAAQRLEGWRALARLHGRRVVLDVSDVPPVAVRPAAIGQSLQVLVDNALQHGAGTVTVSVQSVTGGVRLSVADEGAGIPEQTVASLWTGSGERTGANPGSGRGLPLARALVEAEGGRLSLENRAGGGQVCLLLPSKLP